MDEGEREREHVSKLAGKTMESLLGYGKVWIFLFLGKMRSQWRVLSKGMM